MLSRHHILHERSAWVSRPDAKNLRDTQSLIPRIDRGTHDELHAMCPSVPLLGSYALKSINSHFNPVGDTFNDIDELCFAISRASRHEKNHPLERDLAGLAIESIRLQIPFVRSGIATGRIFV